MPRCVTVDNFRDDPLYPRVERAVAEILAVGKVVAPIDVFVRMGILHERDVDEWSAGRIPSLERVIHGNLTMLRRLLHILRMHAHDLCLIPRETLYRLKGNHRVTLRFTKTNEPRLEKAYSRHFVWPGKKPFFEGEDQRDEKPPQQEGEAC